MASDFGCKIHKAGITLHSIIPIQKDLRIQGGTSKETLTFSETQYLEICKDSNHTRNQLKTNSNVTLKDWLNNPQPLNFSPDGKDYEEPVNVLGMMEQMYAGDKKIHNPPRQHQLVHRRLQQQNSTNHASSRRPHGLIGTHTRCQTLQLLYTTPLHRCLRTHDSCQRLWRRIP